MLASQNLGVRWGETSFNLSTHIMSGNLTQNEIRLPAYAKSGEGRMRSCLHTRRGTDIKEQGMGP